MTGVFTIREDTEVTHGEGPVKTGGDRNDVSVGQGAPRLADHHRSQERGLEPILPVCLQKEPTLPTSRFGASGLQN